jgi:glycosyltransferase involved in cell wall biosynthesis
MKRTLTVICPVFNEEEVIASFYEALHAVLAGLRDRYEAKILFVVDRCDDRTLDILKDISARDRSVQILSLSSRFGHQMSLLAGIDYCHSDVLIMMDSDLQHPPTLIPLLLEKFEEGFDIVFTIREEPAEIGFLKRLSSKLYYRMINLISQVPIKENAADFRLFSRRVAEVFQNQIRERNQFLRGLFSWVGFRSVEIYFKAEPRPAGISKYSFGRMMRFGTHGIISFSKRPLQAAVLVGFIFAAIGLVNALITFTQYFIHKSIPSGWTTLAILISMFSGVQLIFLGIIGEYIGAIFDEVKGRPHYIVEEKINFDFE